MITVVGIGPGNKDYIIKAAIDEIQRADIVIGFERGIKSIEEFCQSTKITKSIKETLEEIKINDSKKIVVIASGDPLFYGITDFLNKNYEGLIKVIPGISSFQYMVSKINMSWSLSYLGSLHGREDTFIEKVKENEVSIWLTDSKHSGEYLCKELVDNNIDANIYIGENLSYDDEIITIGTPEELKYKKFSGFSVVIVSRGKR